jgi:hypothetical protein
MLDFLLLLSTRRLVLFPTPINERRDISFVVELACELGIVLAIGTVDILGSEVFDILPAQVELWIEEPETSAHGTVSGGAR